MRLITATDGLEARKAELPDLLANEPADMPGAKRGQIDATPDGKLGPS